MSVLFVLQPTVSIDLYSLNKLCSFLYVIYAVSIKRSQKIKRKLHDCDYRPYLEERHACYVYSYFVVSIFVDYLQQIHSQSTTN